MGATETFGMDKRETFIAAETAKMMAGSGMVLAKVISPQGLEGYIVIYTNYFTGPCSAMEDELLPRPGYRRPSQNVLKMVTTSVMTLGETREWFQNASEAEKARS